MVRAGWRVGLTILAAVGAGCQGLRGGADAIGDRVAEQVSRPPSEKGSAALPPQAGMVRPEAVAVPRAVFAEVSPRAQVNRIPVIMYHDVVARRDRDSVWFDTTIDELRGHLEFIRRRGIRVLTLDELRDHLVGERPVHEPAIVLTFDDSYRGFFERAYPLLKEYGYPAAVFVHTDYVGDRSGTHPKMDWSELRTLVDEGLVTIGSHTVTHPDRLPDLSIASQERELRRSKEVLERELGVPIRYLSYPNGENDATTRRLAREAGYLMAFSTDRRCAEDSPDILRVGRYLQTRFHEAWHEREELARAVGFEEVILRTAPIRRKLLNVGGVRFWMLVGGSAETRYCFSGRQSVREFVEQARARAGLNGTFFAMASLTANDNTLVGPYRAGRYGDFHPDRARERLAKLAGRPIVLWDDERIFFFSFQPESMNEERPYRELAPGYRELFLGGAWLVHRGRARTESELTRAAPSDHAQRRKRCLFGVTDDGEFVLVASVSPVSSVGLARAVAEAGVREAVLLDSGYSTALVWHDVTLVSGHVRKEGDSRPVPHAILLRGELAYDIPLVWPRLELPRRAEVPPSEGSLSQRSSDAIGG